MTTTRLREVYARTRRVASRIKNRFGRLRVSKQDVGRDEVDKSRESTRQERTISSSNKGEVDVPSSQKDSSSGPANQRETGGAPTEDPPVFVNPFTRALCAVTDEQEPSRGATIDKPRPAQKCRCNLDLTSDSTHSATASLNNVYITGPRLSPIPSLSSSRISPHTSPHRQVLNHNTTPTHSQDRGKHQHRNPGTTATLISIPSSSSSSTSNVSTTSCPEPKPPSHIPMDYLLQTAKPWTPPRPGFVVTGPEGEGRRCKVKKRVGDNYIEYGGVGFRSTFAWDGEGKPERAGGRGGEGKRAGETGTRTEVDGEVEGWRVLSKSAPPGLA